MSSELPGRLRALAASQDGVLSIGQALDGGLTPKAIRSRAGSGRWQRVHLGVYAVHSGPVDRPARLWASVLRAGAGAALSHYTAAEVLSLTDQARDAIHVTVPSERYVARIPGVVVHRSARIALAVHPAAMPPRTRIEETVLDLTDLAVTLDDAVGWATRALGRRLTTRDRLADAMAQRARLRWRNGLSHALGEEGVHSSLEFRYVRDVERPHGLPRGVRQARSLARGSVIYRDVLYDEFALVVELDGQQAHPADQRWRDIRRDNAAAAHGIRTLRYGWAEVAGHACAVAAEVASALARSGYAGARGCGPACPVSAVAGRPHPATAS